MTTRTLESLSQCSDVAALRSAIVELCAEFGAIQRLDILTSQHEGVRQAICFLRLTDPERERALMAALGVGRFGGEVVFVVDLPDEYPPADARPTGPSSQWADFGTL